MPSAAAEPLGFGLVVAFVTYLSIVVGELAPKRLALRHAEGLACAIAPAMTVVSRIAAPAGAARRLTDLASVCSGARRRRGARHGGRRARLVAEAERTGTIETAERRMIAGVLRLGNRSVRGVMTPRGEVDWLDATAATRRARRVMRTAHSRLPIGEGSPEAIFGVVQSRELLAALLAGRPLDLRAAARRAPVVPDTADALDVLATLRAAEVPMALVQDEYGHFEGIVTPTDLTEAIVGAFRSDAEPGEEPAAVRREDGSWLLAGWMPADEMAELIGIVLPKEHGYDTAAASCWPRRAACCGSVRRWRRRAGASRWWTSMAGGLTSCWLRRRARRLLPPRGGPGAARWRVRRLARGAAAGWARNAQRQGPGSTGLARIGGGLGLNATQVQRRGHLFPPCNQTGCPPSLWHSRMLSAKRSPYGPALSHRASRPAATLAPRKYRSQEIPSPARQGRHPSAQRQGEVQGRHHHPRHGAGEAKGG